MSKRAPVKASGTRKLELPNGDVEVQQLEIDQLPTLMTDGAHHTTTGASIGFSYQPYAPGRCTVHITLGCDQDTDTMERATHIALRMAREYALDGMELIREDVESDRFIVSEEYRT